MIIFAWRRQTPPGFVGGAEVSEAILAVYLASIGVSVRFIGSFENPRNPNQSSRHELVNWLTVEQIPYRESRGVLEYTYKGVECLCGRQSDVNRLLRYFIDKASVLWSSQEGCRDIISDARGRLRTASYVHSISHVGFESCDARPDWLFVPSQFVRLHFALGDKATILRPPVTWPAEPTSDFAERSHVLFFNPIPEKGLGQALQLADALPDEKFTFVEGWRPWSPNLAARQNIEYVDKVLDPRPLYRAARLLIVPSVVEDASPRVLKEATLMGCPALGSRRGGIPEHLPKEQCVVSTEDWLRNATRLLSSEADWRAALNAQRRIRANSVSEQFEALQQSGIVGALR